MLNRLSKSTKDTEKIANSFLKLIQKKKQRNAQVVGLYGDLGAGKTTFVKAIAKHLSIKSKINSPTFVIIKKHILKSEKHKLLFHLDAYRLEKEKELLHLGWEEIISNREHLVFIEWPEKVLKIMPKGHYRIFISHTKKGHRNFKIKI
jgi:tRNA threonylcarbamoyladenosine biosynthesis protein TsaE